MSKQIAQGAMRNRWFAKRERVSLRFVSDMEARELVDGCEPGYVRGDVLARIVESLRADWLATRDDDGWVVLLWPSTGQPWRVERMYGRASMEGGR